MLHVSGTMWRIENQPCHSTSCRDNALSLLVLVAGISYRGLQLTTSSFQFGVALWRVVLREEVYFEGPNRVWRALKGFNLEHCSPPQTFTSLKANLDYAQVERRSANFSGPNYVERRSLWTENVYLNNPLSYFEYFNEKKFSLSTKVWVEHFARTKLCSRDQTLGIITS
jgi:hypothetical protein